MDVADARPEQVGERRAAHDARDDRLDDRPRGDQVLVLASTILSVTSLATRSPRVVPRSATVARLANWSESIAARLTYPATTARNSTTEARTTRTLEVNRRFSMFKVELIQVTLRRRATPRRPGRCGSRPPSGRHLAAEVLAGERERPDGLARARRSAAAAGATE